MPLEASSHQAFQCTNLQIELDESSTDFLSLQLAILLMIDRIKDLSRQ
jgi:hypothetical protein